MKKGLISLAVLGLIVLIVGSTKLEHVNSLDKSQVPKVEASTNTGRTTENKFGDKDNDIDTQNKDKNNADSILLVNKEEDCLSSDYVPEELVEVNIRFKPKYLQEEHMLSKVAATAVEEMVSDASKEGIILYGISGYRSYETQKDLYDYELKTAGAKHTSNYVAKPGTSEHQTGLAIDLTNKDGTTNGLQEYFENSPEGIWLKENCYKYGYIIRYPKGKEKITGYSYEPWHIRYVGKEAAKVIHDKDITLEEYMQSK